ncbi:hypothetical protein JEZ13_08680 [bacterium]|nr:hypothetical protein [bacterium]
MYRTFHFVPADKAKYISNINVLNADHIILDLEDSVDLINKDIARDKVDYLLGNTKDLFRIWIRCNSIDSAEFSKDIKLIRKYPQVGLVLPKVETIEDVKSITSQINNRLIVLIESFHSLNNITSIVDNEQVIGLGLGLEDMLINIPRSESELSGLIQGIYQKFILSAKMFNKFCLAGITSNYKSKDQLVHDCNKAISYGFDGKFSIHPNQIEIINKIFSLAQERVDWALEVQQLSNLDESLGYQIISGKLITPPKIKKAKTILSIMEKL